MERKNILFEIRGVGSVPLLSNGICTFVSPQERSNKKLSEMKGEKAPQISQLNTNTSRIRLIKTKRSLLQLLLYEHDKDKLI